MRRATSPGAESGAQILDALRRCARAAVLVAGPACSSSSDEPAPPPPAPAPAPAAAEVPAAVDAPPIRIEGDDAFVAWTGEALALLRLKAPEWNTRVESSITQIRSIARGSGVIVWSQTYLAGEETVRCPGYPREQQLAWYASSIVHDATHVELYRGGKPHSGKDAEVACLTAQRAALDLISPESSLSAYVQGLIDGADDAANQYWKTADRHW